MIRFHENVPLCSDVRDLFLLEHVRFPEDLHRVHVPGVLLLHESDLFFCLFHRTAYFELKTPAGLPSRAIKARSSPSNLELHEKDSTCSAKRGETLLLLRSNEKISLSPGRDYRLREPLVYFRYYRDYYNHKEDVFVFDVKSLRKL